MVAAKLGGPDPAGNARLFTAIEKGRRENVTRDVIERAIKKGSGTGDEKLMLEHVVFEGYAPHKVPVIVEVMTDNKNRTAPDMRLLVQAGPARHERAATSSCSTTSASSRRTIPTPGPTWKRRPSRRARTTSSR